MKWKDSGESADKEDKVTEQAFDEEQYSPWADRKDRSKGLKLGRTQVLLGLLALAIVALVAVLLMILLGGSGDMGGRQKFSAMEQRMRQLEERMDKYDAIDEKVTRIWEQAKSYEKFKDRFDRSEASMSLRMDHLTMSLEALQKQVSSPQQAAAPGPGATEKAKAPAAASASPAKIQYHEVTPGETLFSISKHYDVSVDELLKLNRLKPGNPIQPGQKLIVRSAAGN